jgi:hypothetical protein
MGRPALLPRDVWPCPAGAVRSQHASKHRWNEAPAQLVARAGAKRGRAHAGGTRGGPPPAVP